MNPLSYILKYIYRIKYWIILTPVTIGVITVFLTKDMPKIYKVKTEVYTGVVSGINMGSDGVYTNWNVALNAMDNMINIITSQNTLRGVSLRLLAQHLVKGNSQKDNEYIKADNYNNLIKLLPPEVMNLVDKASEDRTFDNLLRHQSSTNLNFLNILFNGKYYYYSHRALSKLEVKRIGISDIIEIKYENDDPGITYYTLSFLYEEFINQYDDLRFGQANNIVKLLEEDIIKQQELLNCSEDSLANFLKENQIINYDLQTQSILTKENELEEKEREVLVKHNSSVASEKLLKKELTERTKTNKEFLNRIRSLSNLSSEISRLSISATSDNARVNALRKQFQSEEDYFNDIINEKSTDKLSMNTSDLVKQWMEETLNIEKTAAELKAIRTQKGSVGRKMQYLLPHNMTLKQKEREVSFEEHSYTSMLNKLNEAKLRQKDLQITSANLKVITPPTYPHEAAYSKRKSTILFVVVCCMIFIVAFFLMLELFSRKLKDGVRTKRLTSMDVLGAYPLTTKKMNPEIMDTADQNLRNAIVNHFKRNEGNVINLLSIAQNDGKTFLGTIIKNLLETDGFSVALLSYQENFSVKSKEYLLANDINDIYYAKHDDVIIVEHPSITQFSTSEGLLCTASINLIVIDVETKLTNNAKVALDDIIRKSGNVPVFIYLNKAGDDVLKDFTDNIA